MKSKKLHSSDRVVVPPLQMVDDVLSISKCGTTSCECIHEQQETEVLQVQMFKKFIFGAKFTPLEVQFSKKISSKTYSYLI